MHNKRIPPQPGQESVWDYPQPPRLEDSQKHIQVIFNQTIIAETRQAKRVLQTGHPPVYYIPPHDVQLDYLIPRFTTSVCEWKGVAHYYGVMIGEQVADLVGWYYPQPKRPYEPLQMHVAFYAQYVDQCLLDGVPVRPQAGGVYGGWISPDVVGPFVGDEEESLW